MYIRTQMNRHGGERLRIVLMHLVGKGRKMRKLLVIPTEQDSASDESMALDSRHAPSRNKHHLCRLELRRIEKMVGLEHAIPLVQVALRAPPKPLQLYRRDPRCFVLGIDFDVGSKQAVW